MQSFYHSLRRQRYNKHVRDLISSATLDYKQFIQPMFIGKNEKKEFETMPYVFLEDESSILNSIENDINSGVRKFLLFTSKNSENFDNNIDFTKNIIGKIKKAFGNDIFLIADACLCTLQSSGHCGIVDSSGSKILNHESVMTIANVALQYAQSGADCIAPSDMMDGRILAIRQILNKNNYDDLPIMSYSTKFSSALYGPFRDCCNSATHGAIQDRSSYQISPQNIGDAIRSSIRDANEGADILMVKPASFYLDVISKIREQTNLPIAGYHVSGEYFALELLAKYGKIPREKLHFECWTAIKRSGAEIIISYAARNAKNWIEQHG